MLAGELYRSTGSELQAAIAEAQQHLRRLNAIPNGGWVLWNKPWNPVFEHRETWDTRLNGDFIVTGPLSRTGRLRPEDPWVHQRCCTKVLPGGNEGPSNQTVQFYARMDRKLFSGSRVCIACLLRGEWHSQKQRQGHNIGMKP